MRILHSKLLDLECQNLYHSRQSRRHTHSHRHRPSALCICMSDPVKESQEIMETQEFPSILEMVKQINRESVRNGEKQ